PASFGIFVRSRPQFADRLLCPVSSQSDWANTPLYFRRTCCFGCVDRYLRYSSYGFHRMGSGMARKNAGGIGKQAAFAAALCFAVDGATTERRIRINRPDEGRGRCKGSRAWDPRKDFSQCMQQHKILSTSNVILPQQERTEPSGHRPCRHGVKSSPRREPDVPGDLLRAIFGNVTEPDDILF